MFKKYLQNEKSSEAIFDEELLGVHQLAFDNAYDLILYLSEDNRILYANKAAIKKYGYTYEELTAMNIEDLRYSTIDCQYSSQEALLESTCAIFEEIHGCKDGSTFPVEISSSTIVFKDHKLKILIIRDITERKKIESTIMHLANHDSLTNIPNRAYILVLLDEAIKKSRLTGKDVALLIFDIDKFKKINDSFGHPVGDKVLQFVAQSIEKILRIDDSIGRVGGDEFFIVQQNVKDQYDVISLINRIFSIFESPFTIKNNAIKISISIGVCLLSEAKGRTQLISYADTAMYEAKKTPGCSFEFYK